MAIRTLAVKSSAFADWLTGLVFYTDFIALVPPVLSRSYSNTDPDTDTDLRIQK